MCDASRDALSLARQYLQATKTEVSLARPEGGQTSLGRCPKDVVLQRVILVFNSSTRPRYHGCTVTLPHSNNVTACPPMVPTSRVVPPVVKTPQKLRFVTRHALRHMLPLSAL
jgi:hypothetical protein